MGVAPPASLSSSHHGAYGATANALQKNSGSACPKLHSFRVSVLITCTYRRRERGKLPGMQGWAGQCPSSRRCFYSAPFYCAVQSQLNQIEESLHRLHDYQRVSLFSGIFLGLCLYSYHVRELLACWFFFCLLFALVALLILGGLLASHAAKYVMDWTNAGRPPRLVAGIDPVKLQQLPETLESSAILSAETGVQTPA